jgi:membrane associated rhomboid family serine protease
MKWLDVLDRKLEPFAIPGIIRYVVILNALTFVLILVSPGYQALLTLSPELILQGQVWRLFTWIFIPPTMSPIFVVFALMLMWIYGENLESQWGVVRLNLFYLTGMIGCTVAAFFAGESLAYNALLNSSIFFAFATLNPNFQLLLFFVLPVKIKWLAWVALGLLVLQALGGTWAMRLALVVTFTNYLVFFGPEFFNRTAEARKTAVRRKKFEAATQSEETLHKCHVCQRTEVSNPELDFRVAADGAEYCTQHLPSRNA